MLEQDETLHGFTVLTQEPLPEIDGTAYTMRHDATGARLLYLKNDDENKAFSITFKTPPADDTGVFHILEHSVLCGSDRFPVKEPFVNLLKTSMQTFLNALTFPDKTMYPVASTNMQDLFNLADVYLDAVLHPAIYHDRRIFEQEGWHLEVDDASQEHTQDASVHSNDSDQSQEQAARLRYNGVVFNEMTGALADPDSVLYHGLLRALFPESCYAFESGGHPRAIPELTYENYLDTHARHYQLSNAYVVLYGDLDIEAMLAFLDEKHFSCFADSPALTPNPMGELEPRRAMDVVEYMETAPENACVGLAYVACEARDFERVLAADVLMDALAGGNESPLKRAVLDAEIGGDCSAFMMDAQAKPACAFVLRNAKPHVADTFQRIIEEESARLVREGIPRDILEASLAQLSFDLRERDRGTADGIVLAMSALSGWLYDDSCATRYLRYEDALTHMREGLETGYFEQVLQEIIVDSMHAARVDLQARQTAESHPHRAKLEQLARDMDDEDLQAIRNEVSLLRAKQETPDDPQALACLPRLGVADLTDAKIETPLEVRNADPLPCLYHDLATRNIDYVYYYFSANHLTWEDMPYLSVLRLLLGQLGTASHTPSDLDTYTRQHLGAMRFFVETIPHADDPSKLRAHLCVSVAALSEELDFAWRIPREVWETTRFNDPGRIRDILTQRRIELEQSFANEGHARAANRVGSYLFSSGVLFEAIGGVEFYFFIKDILDNFDERYDMLVRRLEDIQARLFVRDALTVSFTGSQDDLQRFWSGAGTLGLEQKAVSEALCIPAPEIKREAFIIPSDVCFVAKGADLSQWQYDGAWLVAQNALTLDYLWNEVRVKGGAYGVGFRRMPGGFARFASFRDPHVTETFDRFDAAGSWLEQTRISEDDLEGYIVSTVASHDAPAKPRAIARRQDGQYFAHRPFEWREQIREEILAATPEGLQSFARQLNHIAQSRAMCAFGGRALLEGAHDTFDTIIDIMGSSEQHSEG